MTFFVFGFKWRQLCEEKTCQWPNKPRFILSFCVIKNYLMNMIRVFRSQFFRRRSILEIEAEASVCHGCQIHGHGQWRKRTKKEQYVFSSVSVTKKKNRYEENWFVFYFLGILSKRTLLSSSSSSSALLSCKIAKIRRSRVSRRHRTHFSIVNLSHQFFLFFLSTDTHVSYQHDCATNTKNWSVQRVLSASFECKIHISQHDDHLQFLLHVFSLLIS